MNWRRTALAAGLVGVLLAGCSDDDDGDPAAFCAAIADRDRFESIFDELDPTDVPAATDAFERALLAEEALRDSAPEAVRSDVDVLVRFFEDLVDGLAAEPPPTGPDDDVRPSIYDELRPRFDQVEAASDRVELYVATNC